MVKSANEAGAGVKGKAVGEERPEHGDDGHHGEALHHGGEDVFAPHEAAVEEGETGAGHHENEGGAGEHPAVVCRGFGIRNLGLELRDFLRASAEAEAACGAEVCATPARGRTNKQPMTIVDIPRPKLSIATLPLKSLNRSVYMYAYERPTQLPVRIDMEPAIPPR